MSSCGMFLPLVASMSVLGLYEMQRRDAHVGLATLSIGVDRELQ